MLRINLFFVTLQANAAHYGAHGADSVSINLVLHTGVMRETRDFDLLFRKYYSPLLMFALRYVDDTDDANDIVSAAYEDLWKNFAEIDESTVKSFLYVSVRNLCIDMLRRRKCHERYVEFVSFMSRQTPKDGLDLDGLYKEGLVKRLFERLKPPTSDILRACYVEERKYKQVASEMNISVSTVKKHIIKALKIVREMRKNIK